MCARDFRDVDRRVDMAVELGHGVGACALPAGRARGSVHAAAQVTSAPKKGTRAPGEAVDSRKVKRALQTREGEGLARSPGERPRRGSSWPPERAVVASGCTAGNQHSRRPALRGARDWPHSRGRGGWPAPAQGGSGKRWRARGDGNAERSRSAARCAVVQRPADARAPALRELYPVGPRRRLLASSRVSRLSAGGCWWRSVLAAQPRTAHGNLCL